MFRGHSKVAFSVEMSWCNVRLYAYGAETNGVSRHGSWLLVNTLC